MGLRVRVHHRLSEVPAPEWNALTASAATPVFDHAWLDLLETAGGLTPERGWVPLHLALWRGSDLVAAAPLYGRTDSWGDFVYDQGFAEALEGAGGAWYPKLVGLCPATPSPGWRVFVRPGEDPIDLTQRWFEAADALAARLGAVSFQAGFTEPAWAETCPGAWYRWTHQHFLWQRGDQVTFDDYLAKFDKNQRRNVRRERQSMEAAGLGLRVVAGDEIPAAWFDLMGQLYERTNQRFGPWAARFLEPSFWPALDRVRHLLAFSVAERPGEALPVALGLLLRGGGRQVGRYWGSREDLPDLYFNVCYYTPIEDALRQGLRDFEPGAGSELKVRRGFTSHRNLSLHRFYRPEAEALFRAHVDRLNRREEARIAALNAAVPFRQT